MQLPYASLREDLPYNYHKSLNYNSENNKTQSQTVVPPGELW